MGTAPPSVIPEANTRPSPAWKARAVHLAIGLLTLGVLFFWLQFSVQGICCGDFDGYYHVKWSAMLWDGIRHGHFPPTFTWLPLTTLSPSRYADQHFLFHILLIPFTWIGDLTWGAKIAAALFGTLAVFSVYWLLIRYGIRYPLLWLLALAGCSWLFYARLSMTKAESVSLLLMVVGVVLLFERKYVWLLPLAFVYVWTYNLFVLLGLLALIWTAVVWWSERRPEWRPLLWVALGIVAGLLINPYFPHDITLFLEHVAAKSARVTMPTGAGFEWYALPSWDFLKSSLVACTAMVVGYAAFGYALAIHRADRKRLQQSSLFLLTSTALLLITIRSVRFMEYWPPFAVLFACFALEAAQGKEPNREEDAIAHDASPLRPKRSGKSWTALDTAPVALLLASIALYNVHYARTTLRHVTPDPDRYQAGAEWLRQNVPLGALIYDLNWGDFPKLFFYDDTHTYVSGLDPLYLQDEHPDLEELNTRLSRRGEDHPAASIRAHFNALGSSVNFLFVGDVPGPPSREWINYIRQADSLEVAYEDEDCMILRIRDQ
jgi:hypothetical protein